jgi:multidrug resistance efflux pump
VSDPFDRTRRALRTERGWGTLSIVLVSLGVMSGLATWAALADIALYEVTTNARVEVVEAARPVAPIQGGRVVAVKARVGDRVRAHDVLFALESDAERLAFDEVLARVADLEARIAALDLQIATRLAALEADRRASDATVAEAEAWRREVASREEYAAEELRQAETLLARDLTTADAVRMRRADLASVEAEVRARRAQARRLEREGRVRFEDRESDIAGLERARVELQGDLAVERAALDSLRYALELTRVRAPIGGRVGELREIRVGSVVQAGQVLGDILPEGELHAVAWYTTVAMGRLHPGQPARLRFPGYPWTQFGTLRAEVVTVGREPVWQQTRVELAIDNPRASRVPLQHSLPAVVEIEVERLSPLELLLRAAGGLVAGQ